MLTQTVGKTAIALSLLEVDPLNPLSLSDTSTDQSNTTLTLNGSTESERLDTDSLNADLLDANSLTTDSFDIDSFDILDAPDTDSLFHLNTINSTSTSVNTMTLAESYDDGIEWGDPLTDQYYWRQQSGQASCAVVAQISVYQSLTGNYISEQTACNYAQSQGWFNPQTGTLPNNVGKILNTLGISTTQSYNATLYNIAVALSEGDKPIVGVDANEIWNPKRDQYGNAVEQTNAGHAVWVTGIDRRSDGSYNVILNDSGISYGRSEVVSYRDFYNAWSDYNCFVSIADNPLT
ncbi:hypothetical protein IFO70_23560 [Phormidium tenue FACHB-886]|nr:hypothetical protein [Phormidium tenue FACHB-886]